MNKIIILIIFCVATVTCNANGLASRPRPPFPVQTGLSEDEFSLFVAAIRGPVEKIDELLDIGVNVDSRDSRDRTPLIVALEHNSDPALIRRLIAHGADVNATIEIESYFQGRTPLMYAAERHDNSDLLYELYISGADVHARAVQPPVTATALAAMLNPNPDALDVMHDIGGDVLGFGYEHQSLLACALKSNPNPLVIQKLIDFGADINSLEDADIYKGLPKILYAAQNPNPQIISFAVNAGCDINEVSYGEARPGVTALMQACDEGNIAVIEQILSLGADPNLSEHNYHSSMTYASGIRNKKTRFDSIKLLLDHGADPNAKNQRGQTNFQLVCKNTVDPELIQLLLDSGADLYAKDPNGWDAFMYACYTGFKSKMDVIKLLIEKGNIDVNRPLNSQRETVLMMTCTKMVSQELIQFLIDKGADVNARDIHGISVLMYSTRGHPSAIPVLIDAGADVNSKDLQGGTPVMYAAVAPMTDTLQLIIDAGADVHAENSRGIKAIDLARKNIFLKGTDVLKQLENLSK